MIAGVCAGLANYLGVDTGFVRVAFFFLGATGAGVLAYGIAWAVIPEQSAEEATRAPTPSPAPARIMGIVVGIAFIGFGLVMIGAALAAALRVVFTILFVATGIAFIVAGLRRER